MLLQEIRPHLLHILQHKGLWLLATVFFTDVTRKLHIEKENVTSWEKVTTYCGNDNAETTTHYELISFDVDYPT